MKLAILYLVLFLSYSFALPVVGKKKDAKALMTQQPEKPELDLCLFCVQFMGKMIQAIIEIIGNDDVIGTCKELCGQLPNEIEQIGCDLLCSYVGIELFVEIIEYEDPDPIFVCQEFDACPVVEGGKATINSTIVSPKAGPVGTTFILGMKYTIENATGPGWILVAIQGPDDAYPVSAGEFTEGQPPGVYNVEWELVAQPSEQEDFAPGFYEVEFALCAGDCTTNHKWGGVYAEAFNNFNITQ
jgi:hypothetical protein